MEGGAESRSGKRARARGDEGKDRIGFGSSASANSQTAGAERLNLHEPIRRRVDAEQREHLSPNRTRPRRHDTLRTQRSCEYREYRVNPHPQKTRAAAPLAAEAHCSARCHGARLAHVRVRKQWRVGRAHRMDGHPRQLCTNGILTTGPPPRGHCRVLTSDWKPAMCASSSWSSAMPRILPRSDRSLGRRRPSGRCRAVPPSAMLNAAQRHAVRGPAPCCTRPSAMLNGPAPC